MVGKKIAWLAILCCFALQTNVATCDVEDVDCNLLNGLYCGLGIGGSFLQTKADAPDAQTHYKENNSCFIGTFALGGGKVFFNRFYLGGEGAIDFSKSKNYHIDNSVSYKYNSVVPGAAVRFGCVGNDQMVYIKPGVSYYKIDIGTGLSQSAMIPSLALGVEKKLCGRCSGRFEGAWNFSSKKNIVASKVEFGGGLNLRVMIMYNARI